MAYPLHVAQYQLGNLSTATVQKQVGFVVVSNTLCYKVSNDVTIVRRVPVFYWLWMAHRVW